MTEAGGDGFLVLLHRTFDAEPLHLAGSRAKAFAYAKRIRATGTGTGPELKPGGLGPPGLASKVVGYSVIEFKAGAPAVVETLGGPPPPEPPTRRSRSAFGRRFGPTWRGRRR